MVCTLTFTSARQKAIKRCFILLLDIHYFSQLRTLTSQTKTLKWPATGLSEGAEISLICMQFFFPPVNILFTWPRMMRYHRDNDSFAYFFYPLHFLKRICVQPGSKEEGNDCLCVAGADISGTEWWSLRGRLILLIKIRYEPRLDSSVFMTT